KLLVSGAGRYVDDIKLPNMLHMAVARSPHARARLISVKGGLNQNDLKAVVGGGGEGWGGPVNPASSHPVFAQDTVNYVGQPVAAVFADDRYAAEDKLDEVEVEYEKLKPIMTIDEALSGEPLHAGTKSNIITQRWLGTDFEDPKSPVVLEDEFSVARIVNNPLEPRGLIADYDGSQLTVYISTQAVFGIKEGLASTLKLDESAVRVIQADTGGAFGVKSAIYPEYIIAAYAAMKYKRPVKWIESRSEHLAASQPGRGVRGKMKLFADKDGKVNVWLGGNQHGQEHYVFVKKLLNEELGIPQELVTLNSGDTGMLKDGVGSWGSRSAVVGGAAIIATARKLKAQVENKEGKYTLENLLKENYSSEVLENQNVQLNSFGAVLATVKID